MIERDFIKRLIQQFAEVVAKILLYRRAKDWEQLQMVIDVAGKQLLGLNPEIIEDLDENAVINLFQTDDEIDHEKCLVLARLLFEQATIYENTQANEYLIYKTYLKTFNLYLKAFENKQLQSAESVEYLIICCDKLLLFKSNETILSKIFEFYKAERLFAKAEDILFMLLKEHQSAYKNKAVQFYEELLTFDDKELKKGNLPREEVIDGLTKAEKLQ